jgi:hypothetical protein
VISQPVGRLIQKYVKTSPDLDGVGVDAIDTKKERFYKVRAGRTVAPAAGPVA